MKYDTSKASLCVASKAISEEGYILLNYTVTLPFYQISIEMVKFTLICSKYDLIEHLFRSINRLLTILYWINLIIRLR